MPKKSKTLCVDDLRHAEYYGMQGTFDELYQTKACKTERYPETKRKNTSAGNPMHMGQVDTAMYQADHGTNLRSKVLQ